MTLPARCPSALHMKRTVLLLVYCCFNALAPCNLSTRSGDSGMCVDAFEIDIFVSSVDLGCPAGRTRVLSYNGTMPGASTSTVFSARKRTCTPYQGTWAPAPRRPLQLDMACSLHVRPMCLFDPDTAHQRAP